MASSASETNLIEGVGNEVLLGIGVFMGTLIPLVMFVNRRTNRGLDIHPDSFQNVATTREQLQSQSDGDGVPADRRRANQRNSGELTCPICLTSATYAVETNCGHVFCGHCMMTYWQHQTWMGAVKCPSCRTQVSILLLNFTSQEHADESDLKREVIQNINQYNRRFSGEWRTIQEYLQDLPTLMRHFFSEFFSLGGLMWMFRLRIGILLLASVIYLVSPLDILPESAFGLIGFLDDIFIILLVAVYISIVYREVIANRGGAEG